MDAEQAKTLEALQYAIKMEIDGKAYYQEASKRSCVQAGKELFEWLAGQEDEHRRRFEQVYKAIEGTKAWPDIFVPNSKGNTLTTLFSQSRNVPECKDDNNKEELESIAKAMELENKTHDYYEQQSELGSYEAQISFYKALAAEERKHYLALVDYREYLIDPAGWFGKSEHHSLDGG